MCDTTGNHSHAHGVRSDVEKAAADMRALLADKLSTVSKMEAMKAVIGSADFPQAGEIAHGVEHILADEKELIAKLFQLIISVDVEQAEAIECLCSCEDEEHEHGGHCEHGHGGDDHEEHDHDHESHDDHDDHDDHGHGGHGHRHDHSHSH